MAEVYGVLPGTGCGATISGAPVELTRGGSATRSFHACIEYSCIGSDVGHDVDVAEHGLDRIREGGEAFDRGTDGATGIDDLEAEVVSSAFIRHVCGQKKGADALYAQHTLILPQVEPRHDGETVGRPPIGGDSRSFSSGILYATGNLGAVGVYGRGVVDADHRSRGRQGESEDGDVGGVAAFRYQVNFISATYGRCAGDDTRRSVHAKARRHAVGVEQSIRVVGSDGVGEGLVEVRRHRQRTGDLGNVARRLTGSAVVNFSNVRRSQFDVVYAKIVHLAVPP